jgi:hypothetical protein
MPRYHFDLVDRTTVADQGGHECDDESEAFAVASALAAKLHECRPDLRQKGFRILVTDQDGEEIYSAPLDPLNFGFG